MTKKIIFLMMTLMCLTHAVKAENIGVEGFKIADGETVQVTLRLTNTHSDLTAFNMTMQLPNGLTLVSATATDRYQGEVVVGQPDTHTYNICGLDLGLGTISGTEGDLLTLTFTADKTFKTSTVTISEIDFITTGREHVTISDYQFTVESGNKTTYLIGDANGSGGVDITDAMTVVAYVLGNLETTFVFNNADVTKDGKVDVADAMAIVDMILGRD